MDSPNDRSRRPARDEALPYYFTYIDKVPNGDIVATMHAQLREAAPFLDGISEEKSLHRYEPGKWSIREALNHINDAERLFVARAFWFARGFDTPLPSYEQDVATAAARAEEIPWARHVEEFRTVHASSVTFFENLPVEAWSRAGIASDNPFTVRSLAWILAGHLVHHQGILREKYLGHRA